MNKLIACMLVGIVAATSGLAQAAAKLSPAVADEVLQKSGFHGELSQIGPSILGGLNLNPTLAGKITDAQMENVRQAFATAYATDRLETEAKTQITEVLPPDAAKQALLWLNSDIGKHITALEDEAGKADGFNERAEAAVEQFKRLPERRIERYVRLVKATNAGEGGATIAINTTLATVRGVAAVSPDAPGQNLATIKAQLEENRPKLIEAMNQQFLVLFSSAYATLEDKDLEQYIAFAESPAGMTYNAALVKVLDGVMTKAALEASQQIAESRKSAPTSGT